jgi:hypothetical protein
MAQCELCKATSPYISKALLYTAAAPGGPGNYRTGPSAEQGGIRAAANPPA